ncbi:uncharacterized protein LOC143301492 [Babylonia areolata]|uniref:uncharacterized protein LOC143301492 n=1 Tax=Babylonia areolata TaxID=304850 RepID=UPI003FD3650F
MTDDAPKASGPPEGQQQVAAPGSDPPAPPPAASSDAVGSTEVSGKDTSGPAAKQMPLGQEMSPMEKSSSIDPPNTQMNITASLIVGDRSRSTTGDQTKKAPQKSTSRHVVHLAGPMRNGDPLYIVVIILAMMNCICTVCGVFLPYAFIVHKNFDASDDRYSLYDSKPCSSYSDDDYGKKRDVCYEGSDGLGTWVLVVQIFSTLGLALNIISIALELLNICRRTRSAFMHKASFYLMAATGFFLLLAGHIGHNRSVWVEPVPLTDDGEDFVEVEQLGNGFFLLCTILCAWCCVFQHVSSHGPGPLSFDTRFLHTVESEEPIAHAQPEILQQSLDKEDLRPGKPTVSTAPAGKPKLESERKDSVQSTAV